MKSHEDGSLTVEAAFIMPIAIFAMLVFLAIFQVMSLQTSLQYALSQVAEEISQYAFIKEELTEDTEIGQREQQQSKGGEQNKKKPLLDIEAIINGVLSNSLISQRVNNYLSVEKEYGFILPNGISFVESRLLYDGETIDIIAKYKISIPVPLLSMQKMSIIQRVKTRAFIGVMSIEGDGQDKNSSGREDIVYVTETGTVYHRNRNCTHIMLSIESCNYTSIQSQRNRSGARYKPCERCVKGETDEIVYITKDGTRYHSRLDCSGLKRTVREVPLEEVNGLSLCKKCGGNVNVNESN